MSNNASTVNEIIDTIFDWFASIVGNIASNIAPLAAGVLPAYMTWVHIVGVLGYPAWVAWSGALVVEFLGLGAGQELMEVWNHNRKYKDEKVKMPMLNAGAAAVWYVAIMIAFNVILEAAPDSTFWKIASQALFATLAIPGYALVAAKTLRKETVQERRKMLQDRRSATFMKNAGNLQGDSATSVQDTKRAPDLRKLKGKLQLSDLTFIATSSPEQIMQKYGSMSERTAYGWKNFAEAELVKRNGNGQSQ